MLALNLRAFNAAGALARTLPKEQIPMPSYPSASQPSIRQAIDLRRFPWMRPLALDYLYDFGRLAPFFAGNPMRIPDWEAAIVRTQVQVRRRAEMADVLGAQLRGRGAPSEAIALAGRLADPRTVAVLTGQQAGLFGGPLFTLLKAITALKLAARIEREFQVPSVAVFWVDAEDHDWDEVASCAVLDTDLERRVITLGLPPGAGDRPVASVRLDHTVTSSIDDLAAALGSTEFSATLLTRLRNSYRSGAGMAEAFARWLDMVLGEKGLLVYDASDPAAKPLAREVFARELATPGVTARLAGEAGRSLVEHGYHAQAETHEGAVALFHLDGGRRPMRVEGDSIVTDASRRTPSAWAVEALTNPAAFSPNVLLRPVVQDTLFPTVCYVAGPNELAYLAQLGPVYEHFGVPLPLFLPRASVTLLDSAAVKFLARHDVALESLQPGDEAVLNRLLMQQLPAPVEAALGEATSSLEGSMARLIAAIPEVDPTLEGAARSVLGRMQHELGGLHDKVIHAAKKRDDTLRRQFRRTRAQAFPGGHPQERAIGFVSMLNRYGPALVERLLAELPVEPGHHFVFTL